MPMPALGGGGRGWGGAGTRPPFGNATRSPPPSARGPVCAPPPPGLTVCLRVGAQRPGGGRTTAAQRCCNACDARELPCCSGPCGAAVPARRWCGAGATRVQRRCRARRKRRGGAAPAALRVQRPRDGRAVAAPCGGRCPAPMRRRASLPQCRCAVPPRSAPQRPALLLRCSPPAAPTPAPPRAPPHLPAVPTRGRVGAALDVS